MRNHAILGLASGPRVSNRNFGPGVFLRDTQWQSRFMHSSSDETLGHVTKVTAEGESKKNTSQMFLTGGKKLVNLVCFVWDVARKHIGAKNSRWW